MEQIILKGILLLQLRKLRFMFGGLLGRKKRVSVSSQLQFVSSLNCIFSCHVSHDTNKFQRLEMSFLWLILFLFIWLANSFRRSKKIAFCKTFLNMTNLLLRKKSYLVFLLCHRIENICKAGLSRKLTDWLESPNSNKNKVECEYH